MSYSRRQLYAMGEPLGDSATYRKADGGLVLGGGGSSSPPAVTSQTQVSDLAERLQPYQMDILNRGQALTDIKQNPYQAYGGTRVADFGALQKTAMGSVASPEAWGQNVQGYMSPYMENVVKRQQQNAIEQAGTQMGALNARAAQANAFGGSGIALQRAAQNRDLQRQLGDIQATGAQNAFQQGVQQANTAVAQQTQLGGLEQQNQQRALDTAYQNFLEQKNYPYQQLSYMSNLLRGTPMGMNSASQVYQAPPTTAQNLAALGAGAYGVSQLAKTAADGGLMQSYAEGGEVARYNGEEGSVTSQGNMEKIVHEMKSDQELQQAFKAAQARGDIDELDAIQKELAMRASLRRGLAGTITNEMADRFAGGGILAFANRGVVDSSEDGDATESDPREALSDLLGGGASLNSVPGQMWQQSAARLAKMQAPSALTRDQRDAAEAEYVDRINRAGGPDPYGPAMDALAAQDAAREKALARANGLAALAAIPVFLQPGGTARGIGGGFAKWGEGYGVALKADEAKQQYLDEMRFKFGEAKRKEKQGLYREARQDVRDGEIAAVNAFKAKVLQEQAIGGNAAKVMQAMRPVGGAGAGRGPKPDDIIVAKELQLANMDPTDPKYQALKNEVDALRAYQGRKAAGLPGAEAKIDADVAAKAGAEWKDMSRKDKKAFADRNGIDVTNPSWLGAAQEAHQRDYASRARPAAQPAPAPAPAPKPDAAKADLSATVKTAFGSYEPDKYDYRVIDGKVQRKRKE